MAPFMQNCGRKSHGFERTIETELVERLRSEIQLRHDSRRPAEAYTGWVRRYVVNGGRLLGRGSPYGPALWLVPPAIGIAWIAAYRRRLRNGSTVLVDEPPRPAWEIQPASPARP